jgi:serine/threonine/tyrosine-interacting protein
VCSGHLLTGKWRAKGEEILPRAKEFIDAALQSGGRVLVHCSGESSSSLPLYCSRHLPGGISLSPAFVVMFTMEYYQLSWEDALRLVQNKRYCISPNSGFITQIKVHKELSPPEQPVFNVLFFLLRSMKAYIERI